MLQFDVALYPTREGIHRRSFMKMRTIVQRLARSRLKHVVVLVPMGLLVGTAVGAAFGDALFGVLAGLAIGIVLGGLFSLRAR